MTAHEEVANQWKGESEIRTKRATEDFKQVVWKKKQWFDAFIEDVTRYVV